MRVLITILIISITNVFGHVSGRVPGPNDPDTYPGKTIRWSIRGIGIVEQTLVGVAKRIIPTKNNIDIFFYSRKHPFGIQILWNDTSGSIRKTDFNPYRPTLFVTHGWLSDRFSESCVRIRNAAITTKDVNVFVIDWSKYSKTDYITARSSVDYVGRSFGEFVKKLVDVHGLKLAKTTIVGHSLGAHVAGLAGAFLGGKVEIVIGLDPAWPLFYYSKPGQRLNKNNAKIVQVIHTNNKLWGFPYSIGTSDYYPNGGTNQFGCFMDVTVPGPEDPDTYPGKTIEFQISLGLTIEESLDLLPDTIKVVKNDVKIFFHCNSQPEGVELDITDISGSMAKTHFQQTKMTFFIIHGWRNDRTSDIFTTMKGVLLHVKDVNLFIVDWSTIAKRNYVTACFGITDVGKFVGEFINGVVDGHQLDLDQTQIVGHSLGAHVAGIVGATIGGKAHTITGLDPAWPLFYFSKPSLRLNDQHAKFVQVIHTNGRISGFPYSIGTCDYYPNGGESQAGCILDLIGMCGNKRAYEYYAESIETGNFVCWECTSYELFKQGQCKNNQKTKLGQFTPNVSAHGDFYLDTNPRSPYAKGG